MSEALTITWLWSGLQRGQWIVVPGDSGIATKDHYEFNWLRQGKVHIEVEGEAFDVHPEDILLFRPGQEVRWSYDKLEPSVVYTFFFDTASIPTGWPAPRTWPVKRQMPPNDIIRPLFEFVAGHGMHSTTGEEFSILPAIQSAIETMMTAFINGPLDRPQSFPRYYPAAVLRTVAWMSEMLLADPSKKVTSDDLAAVAGVSLQHLSRLFHQYLGNSPMEVLYIYRITRSLIGLRAGRKVESVALELGFSDAAHFSRRFRDLFGKTPSAMQKALAKGYRPKMPKLPLMGS